MLGPSKSRCLDAPITVSLKDLAPPANPITTLKPRSTSVSSASG
jgi:hypothetical protein